MLKIRLRRMGARHRPFYRVVVSESRNVPTGAFVENLGHYDPLQRPATIQLDMDRLRHWIDQGAQPTPRVQRLMKEQQERSAKGETAAGAAASAARPEEPPAAAATDAASDTKAPSEKEETAAEASAAAGDASEDSSETEETSGENGGEDAGGEPDEG